LFYANALVFNHFATAWQLEQLKEINNPMRTTFITLSRTLLIPFQTALLFSPATLIAGSVFINSNATLPNFGIGSVAWGDYNNDGQLDILVAGNTANGSISEVLVNQGNAIFSNINVALPGLDKCSVAWGDYDNDGNLDILISGVDSSLLPDTEVWHNQGNGTFVNANVSLHAVGQGAAVWADLNNDGKIDILLSGNDINRLAVTEVYQNLGGGSFAEVATALPNTKFGSIAVADLVNDGYLDVIITGVDTNGIPISQVWHNLGGFKFTNVPVSFTPLSSGSVAVGDFNHDGFPDILLTGINSAGSPVTELWQNNGNLTFTKVINSLTPVYTGAAVWGDFDNDGLLDVLIAGTATNSAGSDCQVFKGLGDGTFSNQNIGATDLSDACVAWGDFSSDGRLDFIAAGYNGGFVTQLWQNQTEVTNTPPTAPSGLTSTVTSSGAILSWSAGSDAQTPAAGLSYNIRVGTNSGGISVVAPAANVATGFRRLPQLGNAQERHFSALNLPPGSYFWSVQSVDSAFAGSPFAREASFVIDEVVSTDPATSIGLTDALLNGTVNPLGLNTAAWFQWGTSTNYGNATPSQNIGNATTTVSVSSALLNLQPGTTYYYNLVATDTVGVAYGSGQSFTTLGSSPPSISPLSNISTDAGVATAPIPITLNDAVFPTSNLLVTAISSSSSLIPPANLVLGGSGSDRTLTITPAPGQTGSAAITVSATDGVNTTFQSFIINVGIVPGDVDNVGYIDQNDLNGVLSNYWPHTLIAMTNPEILSGGLVQFTLTNISAWDFTVMVSTDLVNWSVLPTEAFPVFQFVDPESTNLPRRFYQLRWP